MAPAKKTLYEILGVPRDANSLDVGLAHERRVAEMRRAVPPDPSAEALVQQAFEILSNDKRRAAYDAQLLTAAERSAASAQATTDLEIGEAEPEPRKLPLVPIAIVAALVLVVLFVALRSPAPPPPPPPVAAAPKPPPPPAPKARTGSEILGAGATSTGQLLVYSMSGNASPIGMAVAIDAGTMVTTCHGIPAGGKLVVRVGKEQHPVDLTITDETLDLCRLAVTGYTTPPVRIEADAPRTGDKVYLLAYDAKGELSAIEGTVTGVREGALEISMQVPAGASGAGVFDQFGNLAGIATSPHERDPGKNIAISAASIARMRSRAR